MKKINAPIEEDVVNIQLKRIYELKDDMKSSMQRDIEKNMPIEVDHLQGFLLEKARQKGLSVPVLETIYTKLTLYEEERRKLIQ